MRYSPSSLLCTFSPDKCSLLNVSVLLFVLVLAASLRLAAEEATIVGTITGQTGGLVRTSRLPLRIAKPEPDVLR